MRTETTATTIEDHAAAYVRAAVPAGRPAEAVQETAPADEPDIPRLVANAKRRKTRYSFETWAEKHLKGAVTAVTCGYAMYTTTNLVLTNDTGAVVIVVPAVVKSPADAARHIRDTCNGAFKPSAIAAIAHRRLAKFVGERAFTDLLASE